jgi:hypothetical protein
MPSNLDRLVQEPPRSLLLARQDARDATPWKRERVSRKEHSRRIRPLLAAAARGDIELDEQLAKEIARELGGGR